MKAVIIITSTIIAILLTLYFLGVVKVEKYKVLNTILVPIKQPPKVALCFTPGGLTAMSCIHGCLSSFYQKKRQVDANAKFSSLFKNVRYLSGVSGGSWYGSQLLYNKQFNDVVSSIGVINAQTVKQKWLNVWITDMVRRRTQLRQDPTLVNIVQNLLPSAMGLIVKLILEAQSDYFSILTNLPAAYGDLIFGSSINGKKMTDILKEYKHIIYTINISINNDGSLNVPSKNIIEEKITYSLDQKGMFRFPCRPGYPSSTDRLYNGTLMTNSTGEAFNSIQQGALSVNPPDPLFDNLLLDTCKWIPKYERGWFGGRTPTGEKVYRCKNVSAADCCPPTGGNRYNGTKLCTQGTVSSSDLPLIPSSVVGSQFMSGKIQYNIYNMETERAPTGEWPNDDGLIEDSGSKRSSAVADIRGSNMNTKHLLVKDAAAASGMGFNVPVCLQKSILYRSGTSDQEDWIKLTMDLLNVLGAGIKLEFDNPQTRKLKIYSSICSNTEQYYCAINNIAPKDKMNLLVKNKLVNLADGLQGGDTYGIITNLLQYEKELASSRTLVPPNIISTVKDTDKTASSSDVIKYFLEGNSTIYNNYQNRYMHDMSLYETTDKITDIINQIANWNFAIEAGVILVSYTVDTVVTLLMNALIPYFGQALSIVITTLINEAALFIVDLDIDNHERILDNSGMILAKGKIFNAKYFSPYFTTNTEDVSPLASIRVRLYKDIPVVACQEFGLKGGYNIPHLYIIETFAQVSIFQFVPDINQDQEYGNLAADVFTGLNTLHTRHQEVRDMFKLLM